FCRPLNGARRHPEGVTSPGQLKCYCAVVTRRASCLLQAGGSPMRKSTAVASIASVLFGIAAASPAAAQYGMDKKPPKNAATPELPRCDHVLGRASLREPEQQWWT